MTRRRQPARYQPKIQDVPQKQFLDLDFPDENGEDQTHVPGEKIARPKMGRLDTGTSYLPDETQTCDIPTLTAPVHFPSPDKLQVNLVPRNLVYDLEQCHGDQNLFMAVFWALLGAMLGVVINWLTAEKLSITKASLVLLGILALFAILSGVQLIRLSRRAQAKKREIEESMS